MFFMGGEQVAGRPDGAKRNPGSTPPLAEVHHGVFDAAGPVGRQVGSKSDNAFARTGDGHQWSSGE